MVVNALKIMRSYKGFAIGAIIVSLVAFMAIFAPFLAPYHYAEARLVDALQPPGFGQGHLLGTDKYGRDILSRMIYGARLSLMIGIVAQVINLTIGVPLGLVGGYFGGYVDDAVMGLVNVTLSMPVLILALAIMTLLGPGIINLFIALGIVNWCYTARITRSETLSTKEMDYVEAAKGLGSSTVRIMRKHILPNIFAPILVIATLGVADAILLGAALGFLGLGAQPPRPEWGTMLSHGRDYIRLAPWITIIPGVALVFTIMGFNLLGDGIRDILDPHMKTEV